MKFSIKDLMCPNLHFPAEMVTFTEEVLNGKLHFLRYFVIKISKY